MNRELYKAFSSVELSKDFLANYRSRLPRWSQNIIGIDRKALQVAEAANLSEQKLLSLGVLWPSEVDRICAEQTRTQFLVADLLPAKSIAIAAGESTIGKSPLMCQLALCVASGQPFLGMATDRGRVLYFDLENSILDCQSMRDSLLRFLGLAEAPRDFLLMPETPRRRLLFRAGY